MTARDLPLCRAAATPAAELAQRIRVWLAKFGSETTSSFLLYEAMKALEQLAAPRPASALQQPATPAATPCPKCETVKHCSRHGCIPITLTPPPQPATACAGQGALATLREQDMAALIRRLARQLRSAEPRSAEDSALAADALDALRRWGMSACVLRSAPAVPASAAAAIATTVCREVAELPDRDSPPNWPQAMLVTAEELRGIVLQALATEGVSAWRRAESDQPSQAVP